MLWMAHYSIMGFPSSSFIPLITAGVLVLVPNSPMINLLVTSFVFVCAAHEINGVTSVLANSFVPPGRSRKMSTNLAIFAGITFILAVNHGMSDLGRKR